MKKLLFLIILLLVIVVGIGSFMLPGFVSSQVETKINDELHPSATSLKIDSSPSAKMLLGDIDMLRGNLSAVKMGDLEFVDVSFDVRNMKIDPIQLLSARHVVVTKVGDGVIEGTVTQQALQEFMEKKIKGLEISKVAITSNGIEVIGNINIGGFIKGEANVKGQLEVKNNALMFNPEKFSINGMNIGGLTSAVFKEIVIYDFANFPIPVLADTIKSSEGEVHLILKPLAK